MNQVKNPLFQWSLTLALLSGVLSRVLLQTDSPVVGASPGLQIAVAVFLSLLALTGIVLGVMSWKRKELKVGWSIVVIVLNVAEFLLVLLRWSILSAS